MLNSLAINELFEKLFKKFLTEIHRIKGRRMKGGREGRKRRTGKKGGEGREGGRQTE